MDARPGLSPAEYRLLVEHSPVMIWRAGTDAKCDFFNETWLAFTGRTLEQEFGDGWAAGVHEADFDRCLAIYLDHFARREPFEMEYRLRRHDGVYRYIFDRGVPYRAEDGRFAGYIGSCVDVDERHRAEESKTTFLSTIAHELRTPLAPLRALPLIMEKLAARGEAPDARWLDILRRQTARFSALVDDLGEAARLEEHRFAVRPADADVRGAIEHVIAEELDLARGLGRAEQVRLSHDGGEHVVRVDVFRFEQVIRNLLSNAIKYSTSTPEVDISVARRGDRVEVVVVDQGIGIPMEELNRVGQRYFRASNAPEMNYPGLGLGLAFSKEIIERHGGRLTVESDMGTGTSVRLDLPVSGPT